jgi:hypothetical protein
MVGTMQLAVRSLLGAQLASGRFEIHSKKRRVTAASEQSQSWVASYPRRFSGALQSAHGRHASARGVRAMVDSKKETRFGGYETIENVVLLAIALAFFVISLCFLAKLLINPEGNLAVRIGFVVISFVLALICFTSSPANQGRTLRRLLDRVPAEKVTMADMSILQRSVGTPGFFNRIGLTGIPLAVALLALVFCVLTFLAQHFGPQSSNLVPTFEDLTKLTVGAFIGALTKSRTENEKDLP